MISTMFLFYFYIITLVIMLVLAVYSMRSLCRTLNQAQAEWQAERKDLLDRIMARDLPEVKQAQAIENRTTGPKPTSKRQNDARLIAAAEKAERE